MRNQVGYFFFDRVTQPIQTVIAQYRQQWKLPAYQFSDQSFSQLAQISQQPPGFDFPRQALPKCFHYVGPLRNASPRQTPFPYEKLTGQPLIYASLGTLQNTKAGLFHQIAAACEGLDVQLVIAHGGGMSPESVQCLPGSPLVVTYAPQLELLARATLTITHAGLNTVLDSLSHGVPAIAIPITYEQPAIAARLSSTGAGAVLPLRQLTVPKLKILAQRVIGTHAYRMNAAKLGEQIQRAGGVKRAAELIEESVREFGGAF